MSGGHWNYMDSTLSSEIFDYYIDTSCGLSGETHEQNLKRAVRINPLKDPEISGLLYDIFCLLHSYDWAVSGDTSLDDYRKDVADFKARWLGKARRDTVKMIVDMSIDILREDLYTSLLPQDNNSKSNG